MGYPELRQLDDAISASCYLVFAPHDFDIIGGV